MPGLCVGRSSPASSGIAKNYDQIIFFPFDAEIIESAVSVVAVRQVDYVQRPTVAHRFFLQPAHPAAQVRRHAKCPLSFRPLVPFEDHNSLLKFLGFDSPPLAFD